MGFGNQFPNSTLGQSGINIKGKRIENAPDTDSRLIRINGDTSVYPNLMHDHTRIEYISPSGNLSGVTFHNPVNTEDRSLHVLTLDNSNNGGNKVFTFSANYVFLDDPGNATNTYTVTANAKQVWYGTFYDGKLRLRVSDESTN
tara:strand:- start:534 stop:965 length:432 start_codon:yes stop_codon:yes gene_type:complete